MSFYNRTIYSTVPLYVAFYLPSHENNHHNQCCRLSTTSSSTEDFGPKESDDSDSGRRGRVLYIDNNTFIGVPVDNITAGSITTKCKAVVVTGRLTSKGGVKYRDWPIRAVVVIDN